MWKLPLFFFFLKQASTFYICQSVWWFDLILFHFSWKTFIQYIHANKTRSKFGTCSFRWLLLGPEVENIPLFQVRNCLFLHFFFFVFRESFGIWVFKNQVACDINCGVMQKASLTFLHLIIRVALFAFDIFEFLVFRDLPLNLTEMVMEVSFLVNSRIIHSVYIKIYGYCNRYKVSYLARFCFLFEFWLLLLEVLEK